MFFQLERVKMGEGRGLGNPLTRKVKIHHNEIQVWKHTMGDNRGQAYLQNPFSKTAILLKLVPNAADIVTSAYLY